MHRSLSTCHIYGLDQLSYKLIILCIKQRDYYFINFKIINSYYKSNSINGRCIFKLKNQLTPLPAFACPNSKELGRATARQAIIANNQTPASKSCERDC